MERELVLEAARLMTHEQATEALARLTECVRAYPESAAAHHLMGAQFAQLSQYDEACRHLALAVHHAPRMHEARLQLALLLFTLDRVPEARATLEAADVAEAPPAIAAFLSALSALANDDVGSALASLDEGLAVSGKGNLALLADMQQLRERLNAPSLPPELPEGNGGHVLLNAYGVRQQ